MAPKVVLTDYGFPELEIEERMLAEAGAAFVPAHCESVDEVIELARALRPRRSQRILPMMAPRMVPSGNTSPSASSHPSVTRLNRFSPKACGPQSPCLRLTDVVADIGRRLGMECVGRTLLQWLSQPPVTRRLVAHRISEQSGHSFRSKVPTHFGAKWPPVSV